jgi:hypothetical protein
VAEYWYPEVPSLKWQTLEEASASIAAIDGGMKVEVIGEPEGEYVIRQFPGPGEAGHRDGTVKVVLGPKTRETILASD